MPFEIVRNDITNMQVDAIVNAASRLPRVNAGVDSAIHKKAGPSLLVARKEIGYIQPGTAAITPAFELDAEYGIQTRVGLHCAPSAHETLGTYPTGTIRFSFGWWNRAEQVDQALNALKEICRGI